MSFGVSVPIFFIFLIALAIRVFFVFYLHPTEKFIFSDMQGYFDNAQRLITGQESRDIFFQSSGFTVYLAALYKIGGWPLFKAIQAILSALTILISMLWAKGVLGLRIAILSGLFLAFHFPIISLAGFALTETLYSFLITLLCLFCIRDYRGFSFHQSIAIGIVFALSFYVRGNIVFFPIVFAALTLLRGRKDRKSLGIMAASAVLIMIFHGIFSYSVVRQWKWSAENGGLNFVEAQCPWKHNISHGVHWMSPLFVQLNERGEREWDEPFWNTPYYLGQGLKCISDNPKVLLQDFRYITFLFIRNQLWPTHVTGFGELLKASHVVYLLAILPGLMLFFIFLRQRTAMMDASLALMISLFIVCYLFKSEIRYRIPYDAIFVPLSLWGWGQGYRLVKTLIR